MPATMQCQLVGIARIEGAREEGESGRRRRTAGAALYGDRSDALSGEPERLERLARAHLGDEGVDDGAELSARPPGRRALALVGGPAPQDDAHELEVLGAPEPLGCGSEHLEPLLDRLGHEL